MSLLILLKNRGGSAIGVTRAFTGKRAARGRGLRISRGRMAQTSRNR